MSNSRALACAALLALAPAVSHAQPAPGFAEIRAGLAGEWTGALGYRDYQSNALIELPVKTMIENVPDGVTQVRRSVFDEGARQPPVWITSLSQLDKSNASVTAIMRAGRSPELLTEAVELASYTAPDKWIVIYRRTGTDDDKPAEIRVTETRQRDRLISVKEVRPAGQPEAAWQFRNQTRLTLVRAR